MTPGRLPGEAAGSRLPAPGPWHRPLRRRTLLRSALAGLAAPSVAALVSSCGEPLTTGEELIIPTPEDPVRWPLSTKYPMIESGLRPEPGSTLRVYNYADYLGPGVIKNFEAEYGVKINLSTFNDADEALTKIASEELGFDVYFPSYDALGRLVQAELARPLNQDYIPNADNLWPKFRDPWYDLGWQYSVPYTVYTTGIGWREDRVEEDIPARENPWDVFWDSGYRGELAVIDDWHTTMGMVLLRNGIADVNTENPTEIQLMRQDLLALRSATKPRVTISMYNDLPAGQYGLCLMWSGDAVNSQYYLPEDTEVDVLRYWFPEDGMGMVDNDLIVLLGQGENPVAAHHFVNYLLDAEVATANFGFTGYQPPQLSLTPGTLVADGFIPQNLAAAAVLPEYFSQGSPLLQLPIMADTQWHQIWQEFKSGG